jgi:hypothetical protein
VGTCTVPLTDDLYAPSGRAQQIITAPVVSAKGKARGTLSLALEFFASARNQQPAATEKEARSLLHWSPYDRVGVVNADP